MHENLGAMWLQDGRHTMMVITDHCNNIARRGIVTRIVVVWLEKTILSMFARHAKGEGSLFPYGLKMNGLRFTRGQRGITMVGSFN